jgi:hypothetical protein
VHPLRPQKDYKAPLTIPAVDLGDDGEEALEEKCSKRVKIDREAPSMFTCMKTSDPSDALGTPSAPFDAVHQPSGLLGAQDPSSAATVVRTVDEDESVLMYDFQAIAAANQQSQSQPAAPPVVLGSPSRRAPLSDGSHKANSPSRMSSEQLFALAKEMAEKEKREDVAAQQATAKEAAAKKAAAAKAAAEKAAAEKATAEKAAAEDKAVVEAAALAFKEKMEAFFTKREVRVTHLSRVAALCCPPCCTHPAAIDLARTPRAPISSLVSSLVGV